MSQPFHQTHFFIDKPFIVMKGEEVLGHYGKMRCAKATAAHYGGEVVGLAEAQHRASEAEKRSKAS